MTDEARGYQVMRISRRIRSSWQKSIDFLVLVWLIQWTIKFSIIMIVQCYFIALFGKLRQEDLTDTDTINSRLRVYSILSAIGSNHRELGTTAVFCYSLYTGLILFYPYMPSFYQKFQCICQQKFIVFLLDEAQFREIIRQDVKKYVAILLSSNAAFAWSVHCGELKDNIIQRARKLLHPAQGGMLGGSDHFRSGGLQYKQHGNWSQRAQVNRSTAEKLQRLNAMLSCQDRYLSELLTSEGSKHVWPINRTQEGRARMQSHFLYCQSFLFTISMFVAQIAAVTTHWWGGQMILKNEKLPEELRKYSMADRMIAFDDCVSCFFGTYWFTEPIAMLIVIIRDQIEYIGRLKDRFESLCRSVDELNKLKISCQLQAEDRELDHGDKMSASEGDHQKSLVSEQIVECYRSKEAIKKSCNEEAIKLYVDLRIFLSQADGPMQLAQLVMSRLMLFISYILLVTAVFLYDINSDHLLLFVSTTIIILSSFNTAFYMCASFSSEAIKLLRTIFSTIAHTTAHRQAAGEIGNRQVNGKRMESTTLDWSEDDSNLSSEPKLIDQLIGSPISPHLLVLFQKLVTDPKAHSEKFVCRIGAGLLKLDYEGLLRVNFWMISIVLLGLKNRLY